MNQSLTEVFPMQPTTEAPDPVETYPNGEPVTLSPELEALLARIAKCSRVEQRVILDRVLRALIGDKPEREYALFNKDGSSYVFLVPTLLHVQYQMTPEFV